jgi:hypothetical protein
VQKIPQWKYLNFRRIPFKVSLLIWTMEEDPWTKMKLAGMFIDSGPISVILDNKKQTIIKPLSRNDLQRSDSDIDKRNSASASEFCFCIARLQ